MNIYQIWRSGKVNRMHTMPQIIRENIAEHTWGVMLLILRYWPECSRRLLVHAHLHDAGELATGDIPGNIRWANPALSETIQKMEDSHLHEMGFGVMLDELPLSDEEKLILEFCDRMEFCISCLHEMRMGNRNSQIYYQRSTMKSISLMARMTDNDNQQVARQVLSDVDELYKKRYEDYECE